MVVIHTVSLFVFIAVTSLTYTQAGLELDQVITHWLIKFKDTLIGSSMKYISVLGSSEFILICTLFLLLCLMFKRDWYNSLFLCAVTFGGILLNLVLKIAFQRERPEDMHSIEVFSYSLDIPSYSFPSGHTMRAVVMCLFLIYISSLLFKKGFTRMVSYVICITIIIAVAASRILLGFHFPSDTVAAVSISIVWFTFCLYFFPFIIEIIKRQRA
ncbi:PAP2 family protein [Bacillus sp. ZZV12-4809]|nr:PAP2 family protein [Bacillus sp. ZZV12-4809]